MTKKIGNNKIKVLSVVKGELRFIVWRVHLGRQFKSGKPWKMIRRALWVGRQKISERESIDGALFTRLERELFKLIYFIGILDFLWCCVGSHWAARWISCPDAPVPHSWISSPFRLAQSPECSAPHRTAGSVSISAPRGYQEYTGVSPSFPVHPTSWTWSDFLLGKIKGLGCSWLVVHFVRLEFINSGLNFDWFIKKLQGFSHPV